MSEEEEYSASGNLQQDEKGLKINVKINEEKNLKKLEEERDDLKATLEMVAEKSFAKERKRVAQKLGMTSEESEEKIQEPSDLDFYRGLAAGKSEQALREAEQRRREEQGTSMGGAAGKATLTNWDDDSTPLQRNDKGKVVVPQNWKEREYASIGEMVEVLREIQDNKEYRHADKEEARKIHEKLMKKLGERETEHFKPESAEYTGSFMDLLQGKARIEDWKKTKRVEED